MEESKVIVIPADKGHPPWWCKTKSQRLTFQVLVRGDDYEVSDTTFEIIDLYETNKMVVNEDGIAKKLPLNRRATIVLQEALGSHGETVDIVGDVVVCTFDELGELELPPPSIVELVEGVCGPIRTIKYSSEDKDKDKIVDLGDPTAS